MFRISAAAAVGLGVLNGALVAAAPAYADDPPFHILSSQSLCNLAWPGSQAMPDPSQPVGTICARQGGLLSRMSRAMPTIFQDAIPLQPGKASELPIGSTRVDPNNPLSDWVIPDCHVPSRVDCQ
jgi:hypothetical protein